MKYKRFYDNLQFTSKDATLSDIILALLVLMVLTVVAFPLIIVFAGFVFLTAIYIIISCLFRSVNDRRYK